MTSTITLCRICDTEPATEVVTGNPRNPSSTSLRTFEACKECARDYATAQDEAGQDEYYNER